MQEAVFIDEAIIYVEAGKGGNGCVAFERQKYKPKGGPSGGDGGNGGSVFLKSSSRYNTLYHFKKYPHHKAEKGKNGQGSNKKGAKGKDLILEVPVGSVVFDLEENKALGELLRDGEMLLIAKGGKGGRGNASFKSSKNQTPRFAQPGKDGEKRKIKLELKILSNVGIIGKPNAGKSTLLSVISNAHPKIADYPFTTLKPYLGIVSISEDETFVCAEIPGLVEGAHLGHGLGINFLKHIERCEVLCQLVDVNEDEPLKCFEIIEKELLSFNKNLLKKKRILVATKIDTNPDENKLKILKETAKRKKIKFHKISAITGEGIDKLKKMLWEALNER